MARPKMLRLPEVLDEIGMSRAAFYRMRARGQAPGCRSCPTDRSAFGARTSTPGGRPAPALPNPSYDREGAHTSVGPFSHPGELHADL